MRTMLGLALLIGGWIIHSPASAQDYRGSDQQRMACTPDVWRLCSDQIPDVDRIVTCLRQNTPQLSSNCRAVFETSAEQQQANRMPGPFHFFSFTAVSAHHDARVPHRIRH